jgi:hypothetical protein
LPPIIERAKDGVVNGVQVLGSILGEKAKDEVAVFLQEPVFAAVAPAGGRVRKSLAARLSA